MSDTVKSPATNTILNPAGWPQPKGYANGIKARGEMVFVGGMIGWDIHGKLPSITDDRLVDTGHITDGELRALYEHALALVYPSTYEGFGLPPLEAMQCGCPAIVSDHDVLVEIGGDATLRCGINDIDGLAAAMKAVYDDPALRAICPPLPGFSSTLWICVPSGMFFSGRQLPGRMSTLSPDTTVSPTFIPAGCRM